MQRFIRVIMGLFIMLSILNPVIDMAQKYIMPSQIPALSTNSAQSLSIMEQAKGIAGEREDVAAQIYKKELSQQMRVMVAALEGVADAKVVIDIKKGNHNELTSMIQGVQIYVTPGIVNPKGQIPKVEIGESFKATADLQIELEKKIKKLITELYQLPKEKVKVKILHS